jgi:hypothetical protein
VDDIDVMLSEEPLAPPTKAVGLTLVGRGGRGAEAREKTSELRIAVHHHHNNSRLYSHRSELAWVLAEDMAHTSNGSAETHGAQTGPKLLWKHSDPESTAMHKYLQEVNRAHNLQLTSYQELHKWSISNIDAFWQSVWKFVGVRAEGDASQVSYGGPVETSRY